MPLNDMPTMFDDVDLAHVKLVASDMDLTLLADDGSMPPNMAERIEALDAAGITFCAASGRPLYTLRDMFGDYVDKMALLSDNGAAIWCRGELVFKDLIDVPTYHELIDFTLADGRGCPVVCGIEAGYLRSCDRVYDSFFRRFFTQIVYVDSLDDLDVDVNKYTVYFPDHTAEDVYAETYADAWGGRFSVTNAGREWIDMMNKHVDKGTGITRLCEHLGIATADALALGDTYNDIQMLETVGHSYVVANAEDHMRSHARFVAPSNNERGAAQVIDRLLELIRA
ncbi:Cof-type HAD-IIB family hydrolase [Collinsella tanakaei]|uniref:Cof-type HAD-IIB family hydrolase n=1 Tax=Collinsella tanakaei TaxID=626935 RepID=UPI001EF5EC58|nr:Cof-type HAD-IIB family hydrolase [Collinsella tanakaei]